MDALPDMPADFLRRIRVALDDAPETRFVRPGEDVSHQDRDARGEIA